MITRMRIAVLVMISFVSSSRCDAQLTHTQALIEREIVVLGGRSESPNVLVWVEFQGGKFRPQHFEMLSHLTKLRWFSAINVNGNADCLIALKSLPELQRLDLESCGDTVEGITHLANHPSLNEVQIEHAKISRRVIEALQSIPNLRILVLENTEFDPKDWKVLADLCKRCSVDLGEIKGLKESDLETIVRLNDELQRQRDQAKQRKIRLDAEKADARGTSVTPPKCDTLEKNSN